MIRVATLSIGRKLYASNNNDINNEHGCWFSHPDGNSNECTFVMTNKQMLQELKNNSATLECMFGGSCECWKGIPMICKKAV